MEDKAHPLKRPTPAAAPAPGLAAGRPSEKLAKEKASNKKPATLVATGAKERVTAYLDPDVYQKLMLICVARKVKISGAVSLLVEEADDPKFPG